MNRRLYRSRTDSMIGGVAGGVAEYLDVDPSIVRIAWAVLAIITGGIFLVLYVVMWIVVPEGTSGPAAPHQPGPGAVPGWTPPGETTSPPSPDASAMPPPPPAGATDADAAAPPATETQAAQAWDAAPEDDGYAAPEHRRRGSGASMVFGALLVLLGVWFLIDEYVPGLDTDLLWPIVLVAIGAALLFISMRRSSES